MIPNFRDAKCCFYCKHDGSYEDRCRDYINHCNKHNTGNSDTGICDDYEEGERG
jgi:hypothetical protein